MDQQHCYLQIPLVPETHSDVFTSGYPINYSFKSLQLLLVVEIDLEYFLQDNLKSGVEVFLAWKIQILDATQNGLVAADELLSEIEGDFQGWTAGYFYFFGELAVTKDRQVLLMFKER